MATISKRIEEFATEKLRSIIGSAPTTDGLNADLQQVYLTLFAFSDMTVFGLLLRNVEPIRSILEKKKTLCNSYNFFFTGSSVGNN